MNKWYIHTWTYDTWSLDLDLTCFGLGIGYAHSSRSFFLSLGCFLLTRGK